MSELTEDELKNNYREVKERIAEAAKRAGRDPKEVTLLAVSKTKPVSNIRTLMAEGQRAFGENYVQELTEKISEIGDAAEWHMIGHLQRNKVKYIIGKVRLIHAVDSVRLAEQIEKEAVKTGSEADVLMEVNIAREESKWGFMEEEALDAAHEIAAFPHVHLHGLMTSAPIAENPEDNRKYFSGLRELARRIGEEGFDNVSMDTLSMGMTQDYEVAVEDGQRLDTRFITPSMRRNTATTFTAAAAEENGCAMMMMPKTSIRTALIRFILRFPKLLRMLKM